MKKLSFSYKSPNCRFTLFDGIILSFGVFLCIYIAFRTLNPDLYFIINNGRFISKTKDLFPRELFSTIHEGFATVIQQPFYSLVIFRIYSLFGFTGIPLFICIFILLDTFMLFRIFKGIKNVTIRCVIVSLSLLFLSQAFSGRPSVTSVSVMIFSVLLLEKIKDGEISSAFALLAFPLSFLELLNHAAFYPLLILLYLGYFFVPAFYERFKLMFFLVISVFMSLLFSIVTPYSYKMPLYLFISYSQLMGAGFIKELRPSGVMSVNFLYAVVIIFCALIHMMKKHFEGCFLAVFGALALVLHVRNMYLLAVFSIPLIKDMCKCYLKDDGNLAGKERTFSQYFFIPMALLLIYTLTCTFSYGKYCIRDESFSPVLAADYLLEHDGKVYCDFNQGAFLELCGIDTYIDARPELYCKVINKKADIYREFIELYSLDDFDYNRFIERYGFKYLLTDSETRFNRFLKGSSAFSLVLKGNGYCLYEVVAHGKD